jgi:uracil-DNA glycosylase
MSKKEYGGDGVWTDGNAWSFKQALRKAGIDPEDCFFTNVFLNEPEGYFSVDSFFGKKTEGVPHLKPVKKGMYLRKQYHPELLRLWAQINHHNPNLIIACGDIPLWACATGENSIDSARGRTTEGNSAIEGRKVLPVYPTQSIRGNLANEFIQQADLKKAAREAVSPTLTRPLRYLHIKPTLDDLEDFYQTYILPSPWLSSDIETKGDVITCISFAPSEDRALIVPFYCESSPDGNYWPDQISEVKAWQFCKKVLSSGKRVAGQNYQFDMQHELVSMGIPNPDFSDDTMLLHHVLQPELKKGLGFLASVYTDENQWKGMHKVSKTDKTAKKGDDE